MQESTEWYMSVSGVPLESGCRAARGGDRASLATVCLLLGLVGPSKAPSGVTGGFG